MFAVGSITAARPECEALLRDLAYLFKTAESVEKIQKADISSAKSALERIGRSFEELCDLSRILELARCEHHQANLVSSAPPGPARHLLQLACGEWTPTVVAARIGVAYDDRPRREINSRRDGRCSEQSI